MNHQNKELILNANLSEVMWKLSLPAIIAMALFGLNAFMDTVYIGQLLDEQALSGVAMAYPLTSIIIGLGSWSGTGAANLLSIALGNNDERTQEKILANSTLLLFLISFVFVIPAYLFASALITMMGGTGAVLVQGVEYFKITLIAAPLWGYGLSLNLIVRGEGKMKTAARIMSYGLIINLILTPIFISYFSMGVAGAAWATNVGMLIYCISGYIYFLRGKASFKSNIRSLQYDKSVFKSIVKMGFPAFVMTAMGLIQAVVVFNAIVNYGKESELAFFAAGNRIQLFLMTPLFGLMRALQPVIGINFGANQYDRVKKSFLLFTKSGFYFVTPFWLILTFFPEESMHLALPNAIFSKDQLFNLRVYMLILPILPFIFMMITLFPAINQEKYSSIIGLARQLIFYVPVMLVLPGLFGVRWVYVGATVIDMLVMLWGAIIVMKLFKHLGSGLMKQSQNSLPL